MDTSLPLCSQQNRSSSDAESAEHAPLTTGQMMLIGADPAMQGPAVAQGPSVASLGKESDRMQCQADGCPIDLRTTKPYCVKKRLCPDHLMAHALRRRGTAKGLWRFCQQCGKLEPIESFDGAKRSCRARLQKRRTHNTIRSTDPWKKQRGSSNYKAKQLQHKQQQGWGAAAAEDDHSDEDIEEQQDMNQDYGVGVFGAAAAVAAPAAASAGGSGYDRHEDEYAAPGATEYMCSPAAAAAAAATSKHPYAGFSARNNLQQQQDLYQSLLYSAALAAATAVAGGSEPSRVPGTGIQESGTEHPAAAGAEAVSALSTLEDALLRIHKHAADATGSAAAAYPPGGVAADAAYGLVGGESWRSSCDIESPRGHKHQHQQQLGVSYDAPSPESIAAILAAMAAGHTDHNRQQQGQDKQVFVQLQERQSCSAPHQQERRASDQHAPQQQQLAGRRSPVQFILPTAAAAGHHCLHSGEVYNPRLQRHMQHFTHAQSSHEQGAPNDAYRHLRQQQQQQQPKEAAAAAVVPEMMDVDRALHSNVATAPTAAWPPIVAAGRSKGHISPVNGDGRLQVFVDQLAHETNTQADAAATLAALRACAASAAAPDPPVDVAAAATSPKQRYKVGYTKQQLEQHHSAVQTATAGLAADGATAGSSPAQSGSSTHADPAAAAAPAGVSRFAAALDSPDRLAGSGLQSALYARASAPTAAQPSTATAAARWPAAASAPADPMKYEAAPTTAVAAGTPAATAAAGASSGVSAVEGLGLLLSAGLNSLLAQEGQNGTAGVQVLTTLLAQVPGAAATLLLAQQQQLQQLQAQQQQLIDQMAQQRQQQQQRYEALIETMAEQQLAIAAAADRHIAPDHAVADQLPRSESALVKAGGADSALNNSKVVAELADLVRDQLQGITKQFAESLAPLQAQVDKLQSEVHRISSVVQVGEIQSELNRIRGVLGDPEV